MRVSKANLGGKTTSTLYLKNVVGSASFITDVSKSRYKYQDLKKATQQ